MASKAMEREAGWSAVSAHQREPGHAGGVGARQTATAQAPPAHAAAGAPQGAAAQRDRQHPVRHTACLRLMHYEHVGGCVLLRKSQRRRSSASQALCTDFEVYGDVFPTAMQQHHLGHWACIAGLAGSWLLWGCARAASLSLLCALRSASSTATDAWPVCSADAALTVTDVLTALCGASGTPGRASGGGGRAPQTATRPLTRVSTALAAA